MKALRNAGITIWIAALLAAGWSCKDNSTEEPQNPPAYTGKVNLVLNHFMEGDTLHFNKWYVNAAGDSMLVNMFRYYVSNIVLWSGSKAWNVKESYYLADEAVPASKLITLKGLPPTTFDKIEFVLGVDSAHNVSGAQKGALDPQNDMFWGWAQGYVYLKVEGLYKDGTDKAISLHIGGFLSPNNCIRTVSIPFGAQQLQTSGANTTLNLNANLNEMFRTPQTISLKSVSSIGSPGANAKAYADNYADMFSFGSIQ